MGFFKTLLKIIGATSSKPKKTNDGNQHFVAVPLTGYWVSKDQKRWFEELN